MFNVGGGEILAILVIALIVLGPDKLPNAARQAGKYLNEFRRISSGFQDEIRGAMDLATPTTDPTPVRMDPAEPADPGVVAETVAIADAESDSSTGPILDELDEIGQFDPIDAADPIDPGVLAETAVMTSDDRATTSPPIVGPSPDVAEAELAVTRAKLAAAQAELAEAEARLAAARTVAGTDSGDAPT